LEDLVRIEGHSAREVQSCIDKVRREEIDSLIMVGVGGPVSPPDETQSWVSLAKPGMVLSRRKGRMYQIDQARLTFSSGLQDYSVFAGQEFGAKVVYWFAGMHLCPAPQRDAVLVELFEGGSSDGR
jgi:hypothetical protein